MAREELDLVDEFLAVAEGGHAEVVLEVFAGQRLESAPKSSVSVDTRRATMGVINTHKMS